VLFDRSVEDTDGSTLWFTTEPPAAFARVSDVNSWPKAMMLATGAVTGSLALIVPSAGATTRPPTAPPGYHLVSSGPIPLRADKVLDTGGQVTCPAGTVPWSGGTSFTGGLPPLGDNINTSAPSGDGWRARYNNASGRANDNFVINGVCAKAPHGYTQQFAMVDNPAMTQASAVATCPNNTVLLGGGVFSTSDSVNAFTTSAFPRGPHAYVGSMWNGTSRNERLAVFAICGAKPSRYTIVRNSGTSDVTANTDILAGAGCPAGSTVVGGGVQITDPRPTVTLGESLPESRSQWGSQILTSASGTVTETTSVICAA
jgi:hypothetical protein